MNVPFVHYGRQYEDHRDEIREAQDRVQREGQLILRAEVEQFERNLAAVTGRKYAVALNSGTDAIELSLLAAGVKEGSEVITSAHTFKATVGAILAVGCVPVIVDIGNDGLIDCDAIAAKVRVGKTGAIIPVHIAGNVCNMNQILAISRQFNIPVIEDACQSLGANVPERGVAQCWSFYPAKILGCNDDGGAVTTDDFRIYEELRERRNHYKSDNRGFGTNSRMGNVRAATLNVKVKYLGQYLARRSDIAHQYLARLALPSLILPVDNPFRVWQDFIVRTMDRNMLRRHLAERGIETMANEYPFSPEYPKQNWPNADAYESQTLRLPCNPEMTDAEVGAVIDAFNSFNP